MIPKILHQSSKELTWEEKQLSKNAREALPEWEYRFWHDDHNLERFRAHFPQYIDDYMRLPHPVARVDVVRCLYLYAHGGIYFDTDYKFFKPIPKSILTHTCILGIEEDNNASVGGGYKLGNAFMGSEAGFVLWPEFVESIFSRFRNGEKNVLNLGGPHALTRFLKGRKDLEKLVTVLPQIILYPTFAGLKLTGKREPETIGVHLCWGSWRNKPLPQRVKNRARRILSAL
jgi:hypothetical protein